MNTVSTNDDCFDEYFNNKRDLGRIIRDLIKLIGINYFIQFM
jgi:hypothetical protein